jgi:hypothetical protein
LRRRAGILPAGSNHHSSIDNQFHSVILSERRAFRAAFGEARFESKDLLCWSGNQNRGDSAIYIAKRRSIHSQ